jgi:phosphoglycerol transferase MdoB-like AlkP superfamily enzyme
MRTRFTFLLRYFIFWMVYFTISRLLFMVYQVKQVQTVSLHDWWGILVRGAWMDLSLTGYILLLSGVFLALLFYTGDRWLRVAFNAYTSFLLALFTLIIVSDFELYRNWGFRIDATPLLYLKTPDEAMASVKTSMIVILFLVAAAYFSIFHVSYRRKVMRKEEPFNRGKWWYVPVFLLFAGTMIIPMRGGFGIAPMNTGKVYFSQNVFSNHSALNAIWNMMYSVSKSGTMYKKYPDYIDPERGQQLYTSMMADSARFRKVLRTDRPNVVLILLESFCSDLIEPLGGKPGVTPYFNRLAQEGILFSRIVASGDRSDKGIIAVVSGFPAQSTQSIIKYPLKASKLPTISGALANAGYYTTFYYGGDPDFANIRSYLYSAKFKGLITQDDFPRAYRNSKWGVHDEYTFQRLLTDMDTARGPYFKMLFTLSNHEPFEMTINPKFKGKGDVYKLYSTAYYTDSCLQVFFEQAKQRDWYSNTLFVLVADHGHWLTGSYPNYAAEKFRIPMLWVGGALQDTMRVDMVGSQNDLAKTLLSQLNIPADKFLFSKNLLAERCNSYAYYAFNDGFGFLTQTDTLIVDHVSRKFLKESGPDIEKTKEKAFSFFAHYQKVFLGL